MIYPIVAYGDPVLNRRGKQIPEDFEGLEKLVKDMFETMHAAHGVGLAAPQIGKSLRLFVVDTSGFVEPDEEDEEGLADFKQAFINPEVEERGGEPWLFNEGCLSIPEVRGEVSRPEWITIRYQDEKGQEHQETFSGMKARAIQHEYDHIEGILFTEHLAPIRRRMMQKRLKSISTGKVKVGYRMRFPKVKKA